MPSYRDSLPEEDRWALSYYVLALSAYKDPLTGEPLPIADAGSRGAQRSSSSRRATPDKAYVPGAARSKPRRSQPARPAGEQRRAAKENEP